MSFANRADIRNAVRQQLNLWPDTDAVAVEQSAVATTLQISDAARVVPGGLVEVDDEVEFVRATDEATDILTVRRADRGTVAAIHTVNKVVSIHGLYDPTNTDLNLLIRRGISWLYPICGRDIWDQTVTTVVTTIKYAIPATIGASGSLEEIYLEDSRTPVGWALLNWWRRVGNDVYFPHELPAGRKLNFHGRAPFTLPVTDATALDVGDDLGPAVAMFALAQVVKRRDLIRSQFTGQSALLESRASNLSELIGSYRDLMRQAEVIRGQGSVPRPYRLRRMVRHG